MMLKNDYLFACYYHQQFFSPEECQQIIELDFKVQSAGIYTRRNEKFVNAKGRYSFNKQILLTPETQWLFKRLHDEVIRANQRFFNFDIDILFPIEVIEYPVEGHFDWHVDVGSGETSTRKLTLVVFLSNPSDYEGGELIIKHVNPYPLSQGTILIFPAYVPHRVEPVISGTRYSLIGWACGPVFR